MVHTGDAHVIHGWASWTKAVCSIILSQYQSLPPHSINDDKNPPFQSTCIFLSATLLMYIQCSVHWTGMEMILDVIAIFTRICNTYLTYVEVVKSLDPELQLD